MFVYIYVGLIANGNQKKKKKTKLLGGRDEHEVENKNPGEMTAEDIKRKYKVIQAKQRIADLESKYEIKEEKEAHHKAADQLEREAIQPIQLDGALSTSFDKYMHYYVQLETINIQKTLDDIEKSEVYYYYYF
ncbi:hypothetical protein RFI_20997 [Reticulomyxa filosa]|uniref:Uncharacterized protein n=1 Tax=Reticulomyxa filosa TaxID=46433 RepID=X6MTC4_RETFI|nr:hypothetical protein RFI_20997 [Reticulomyxa filosa]|eukprot:ETO16355.1 hypothetical protein RFI_20997 [Reticulomyxa filosa]